MNYFKTLTNHTKQFKSAANWLLGPVKSYVNEHHLTMELFPLAPESLARLIEMVVTPDGHVLGRCEGESAFKAFLGASEDLIKNIHGLRRSPNSTATNLAT